MYAWAFIGGNNTRAGIQLNTGGPGGREWYSKQLHENEYEEYHSPTTDFNEALELLKEGHSHRFESYPYVELESKDQYEQALEAIGFNSDDEVYWDPRKNSMTPFWDKPGIYDFRDVPPTFVQTTEEYEKDNMESRAKDEIDFMFEDEDQVKEVISKWLEECAP